MTDTRRYFVTKGDGDEKEVTKEEFVHAERAAGFFNTGGEPEEPGTASFSDSRTGTRGRTTYS